MLVAEHICSTLSHADVHHAQEKESSWPSIFRRSKSRENQPSRCSAVRTRMSLNGHVYRSGASSLCMISSNLRAGT
eukprot:6029755-Amphidinium_carterae.1